MERKSFEELNYYIKKASSAMEEANMDDSEELPRPWITEGTLLPLIQWVRLSIN